MLKLPDSSGMVDCEVAIQAFLDYNGHALVTGGPGSGKTTIALRKAVSRIEAGLSVGQEVLFLSFSRAAVVRIVEASKIGAPSEVRRLLTIQTFHSFFWEFLRTHAYLLGAPRQLAVLLPHDERVLSNAIDTDDPNWPAWEAERHRLFIQEGRIAFDLFASHAARLLEGSDHCRRLLAQKFPLVIVDEAQDTGVEAWRCIEVLAGHTQVVCLADLEQQIFDYLPDVGPERIAQITEAITPLHLELGSRNRRSPGTQILEFGNDIAAGRISAARYVGVSRLMYQPRDQTNTRLRSALGILNRVIRRRSGNWPRSVAILVPSGHAAVRISKLLLAGPKPVRHRLLFDEVEAMLSGKFAAFLLEPKAPEREQLDLIESLQLLANIKSAAGNQTASRLHEWARSIAAGKRLRAGLISALETLLKDLRATTFVGDPPTDWLAVRRALRSSGDKDLARVAGHLDYIVAFNRGELIARNLSEAWDRTGHYLQARHALERALSEDQIVGDADGVNGLHVMTIHKSKGKQFDGVIIARHGIRTGSGKWVSSFVWRDDPPPYRRSRRILRVAITRARHHVLLFEPAFPPCPIVSPHKLTRA